MRAPILADLRIYDGESQVQYALSEERGGTSSQEVAAKILNLGSVDGRTEFDLDLSDASTGQIGEYDRIRLSVDAKDFVVTAAVAGSNELSAKSATQLPPATLYDFTREDLGSNSVSEVAAFELFVICTSSSQPGSRPPRSRARRFTTCRKRKPSGPAWGHAARHRKSRARPSSPAVSPPHVPVDRVRFQVDPKQVNFRRAVAISDASDHRYGASGEITRVRMNRGGTTVVSEEMDVPIEHGSGQVKITVDNGDNPPLAYRGRAAAVG